MQEFFRVLGKRLVWPVVLTVLALLTYNLPRDTNPLSRLFGNSYAAGPFFLCLLVMAWTIIQFVSRAFDSMSEDKALKNINVRAEEYKKLLDSGVINEIEYEVKMTELKEQALKKAP